MKTQKQIFKLTLLFFTGLIMSCTTGGTIGNPKIELTSTNYVDVAMIETNYYKGEIVQVQTELDSLQKILDAGQGDNTTQSNFDKAAKMQENLNTALSEVRSITGIQLPDEEWPVPPNPCDLPGNSCLFYGIENVLAGIDSKIKFIGFYNSKGQLIENSQGEFSPMPDFENKVKLMQVNFEKFKGDVIIKMETISC